MRNRSLIVVILALASLVLMAMGGKGGGFERAPRVDKSFGVTVTDVAGATIAGEKFSWEGRIHIAGSVGMASVTVPFDRVKDLAVGEKREKKVKVTVHLKDGGQTVIDVDADSRCFGEAAFGSFMLTMEEIRTVSFK